LLRALIPVGFMPMFGPGLSVGLMLCPAYAAVPPPIGASTRHSDHDAGADRSMEMPEGMDMSMDMSAGTAKDTLSDPTDSQPASGGMPARDYQQHSLCPFAKSAVLAGSLAALDLPVADLSSTTLALPAPQISWFYISRRAHSPRAPPLPA
jgi:hypothetical protein